MDNGKSTFQKFALKILIASIDLIGQDCYLNLTNQMPDSNANSLKAQAWRLKFFF